MENNQDSDNQYIRRFNDGYVIAKNMPELSEQLSRTKSKSLGFQAMQDGRKQFLDDQLKERLPPWLSHDPMKSKTRLLGKGKDRSNEPER